MTKGKGHADAILRRMRDSEDALRKPKSQVVRKAIPESERRRLLDAFDQLVPAIPARPEHEVVEELTEIRRARRVADRRVRADGPR